MDDVTIEPDIGGRVRDRDGYVWRREADGWTTNGHFHLLWEIVCDFAPLTLVREGAQSLPDPWRPWDTLPDDDDDIDVWVAFREDGEPHVGWAPTGWWRDTFAGADRSYGYSDPVAWAPWAFGDEKPQHPGYPEPEPEPDTLAELVDDLRQRIEVLERQFGKALGDIGRLHSEVGRLRDQQTTMKLVTPYLPPNEATVHVDAIHTADPTCDPPWTVAGHHVRGPERTYLAADEAAATELAAILNATIPAVEDDEPSDGPYSAWRVVHPWGDWWYVGTEAEHEDDNWTAKCWTKADAEHIAAALNRQPAIPAAVQAVVDAARARRDDWIAKGYSRSVLAPVARDLWDAVDALDQEAES